MDESPTIGALAPWFGSKRTLAPVIVRELGPHHAYWEPFCGSMAVLLSKPACRAEVVNDFHSDLVNLTRVIQSPTLGPQLYRRLRRVWFCQQTFLDERDVVRAGGHPDLEVSVDRAFSYFVSSWQGMNGVSGTSNCHNGFARRFSTKGGGPAERWVGAVQSIPQWRKRLERVQVLSSDGIELCEKIEDEPGVVIYADPPYLVKGAKYLHDFTDADHARLATALRRFRKTRVVVSYYAHPRLASLYPGWTVVDVATTKSLVNQGKRDSGGATKAPEVLLINGPSLAPQGRGMFDMFGEDASDD